MRIPFFSKKPTRRGSYDSQGWLKPETKRAIVGVVMFFLAALIVLSFFSAAGPTGEILLAGLRRLFGFLVYLLPVVLGVWGYSLVRPSAEEISWWRILGIALFSVGLL